MSAPKAPRTTRSIAPFDDKLWVVPLKWLDYALLWVHLLFLGMIAISGALEGAFTSLYQVLAHVHNHFGRFALAVALAMFALSLYIGLWRRADVTPYFRRGTYVVFGMVVLQGLMGVVMWFLLGGRPYEEVHLLYGVGVVLALPFFIFVETTAEKRPAMGSYMWGFGLLAGIIVRCILTGAAY